MKILLVEDEPTLRAGLVDLLQGEGHEVEAVADGKTAVDRALAVTTEFLVLDLMLPGLDGFEVCRRVRAERPALPILMLTARGSEDDKVRGLREGADDYLTKPFGTRELLARIEALARRSGGGSTPDQHLTVGDLEVDLGRLKARRNGTEIALTAREARILAWLYRNRSRAVSRAELLREVWGASPDQQTRTVDMTIANLRQKIELDPTAPAIVVTVKGVGYAWGDA